MPVSSWDFHDRNETWLVHIRSHIVSVCNTKGGRLLGDGYRKVPPHEAPDH